MSEQHGRLYGSGQTNWETVRSLAIAMTCAWADYDGFQVGPCPAQPPPTSHLWGWADGRRLRVRIDGLHSATAALLDLTEGPAPDVPHRVDDIVVTTSQSTTWQPDEPRIGPQARAGLHGTVELMTVSVDSANSPLVAALTFVAARP